MAPKAENKMGRWGATSYMIGNTIGSGIFIAPGTILENTTSVGMSLVIWLVSALVTLMIALCYVELGTSIRKSGADFAYLCHAKWYSMAFIFMACGCLFLYPITLAAQAETFAEYVIRSLRIQFCASDTIDINYYAKKLISFSTVWLLLYLNFFSVRSFVSRFQIVASFAKLFSTFAVISIGVYALCFTDVGAKNLANPFKNSTIEPQKLSSAFFAGLYSFDGWDVLNYGVEELADPSKSMLFAAVLGMSSVTIIFLLMNFSYFIVLTVPQFLETRAIATTFASKVHPSLEHIMSLLICIVLIGSINSTLFSASRFLYAAARSGQFPAWISCINERHDSPRAALFLHVTLAIVVSFLGDLNQLIDYIGFSQWSQRLVTVILLIYIRWKGPDVISIHPQAVRLPIAVPLVFLIASTLLIIMTIVTSINAVWRTLVVLIISMFVYILWFTPQLRALNQHPKIRAWADKLNDRSSRLAQLVFNGIVEQEIEDDEDVNNNTSHNRAVVRPLTPDDKPVQAFDKDSLYKRRSSKGDSFISSRL